MTGNNIQYIQTQNLALVQNSSSKVLHEGDSVFVRVLKDSGNNRFFVSINGSRMNIFSNEKLLPGSSFKAILEKTENSSLIFKIISSQKLETQNSTSLISKFFLTNGIPSDQISLKLIQFLQQSGLKIDKNFIQKVKNLAAKFPGKEKKAGEVIALLLSKNIEANEEQINYLLSLLESSFSEESNYSKNQDEDVEEENNFLKQIFPDEKFSKYGLLSFINHIKFDNQKHWVVLPYEWNFEENLAKGVIRLFLDIPSQKTEKIMLNCKIKCKSYYFVLYLKSDVIEELRYCTEPELDFSLQNKAKKILEEVLSQGLNLDHELPCVYTPQARIEALSSDSDLSSMFIDKLI